MLVLVGLVVCLIGCHWVVFAGIIYFWFWVCYWLFTVYSLSLVVVRLFVCCLLFNPLPLVVCGLLRWVVLVIVVFPVVGLLFDL